MDSTVPAVFAFVYLGMFLGEVPGLALDCAGVALLGAIALLVAKRVTPVDTSATTGHDRTSRRGRSNAAEDMLLDRIVT